MLHYWSAATVMSRRILLSAPAAVIDIHMHWPGYITLMVHACFKMQQAVSQLDYLIHRVFITGY